MKILTIITFIALFALNANAQTVIRATKTYNPSVFDNGEIHFRNPETITLPDIIPVTEGNSGNHWITLTIDYLTGGNGSMVSKTIEIRYTGNADVSKPHADNNEEQIAKGQYYNCPDDFKGMLIENVTNIYLTLNNGDASAPESATAVEWKISDENLAVKSLQQTEVHYYYDNAGNRTEVRIIYMYATIREDVTDNSFNSIFSKSKYNGSSRSAIENNEENQDVFNVGLEGADINVYPNPVRETLFVETDNIPAGANASIGLYDLSGKTLYKGQRLNSKNKLNMSRFNNGAYILKIIVNGKEHQWKVVKNN